MYNIVVMYLSVEKLRITLNGLCVLDRNQL